MPDRDPPAIRQAAAIRLASLLNKEKNMGCACLFALLAVGAPRLALLFVWLFTPLVIRAFNTFLIPLLGIIFLPFTTLVYVLVYIPGIGVTGWGWFWVVLGFLVDVAAYGSSGYSNRRRLGY